MCYNLTWILCFVLIAAACEFLLHCYHQQQPVTMATQKVLVTGASGLLGRAIYKEFKGHAGWETMGLAFTRAKGDLVKVDITNDEEVSAIINKFKVGKLLTFNLIVLSHHKVYLAMIRLS